MPHPRASRRMRNDAVTRLRAKILTIDIIDYVVYNIYVLTNSLEDSVAVRFLYFIARTYDCSAEYCNGYAGSLKVRIVLCHFGNNL